MGESEVLCCLFCGAPYRDLIPPGTFQVKCRYCGSNILVPPKFGGAVQPCPNHPRTLAIGLCNKCHESLCGDCLFFVTNRGPKDQSLMSDTYFLCAKCRDEVKEGDKITSAFNAIWLFLALSIVLYMFSSVYGKWLLNLIFVLLLLIIALIYRINEAIDKRYEKMPSLSKFKEKMLELNSRIESLKTTLTTDEIYQKFLKSGLARINPEYILYVNNRLEKYMLSGLDRKEALLKILSEDGLEITPGLHIPPTLCDILHEIERESKCERKKSTQNEHV
ncbi:MAG: hypothetical protein QXK89_08805 [Candidatus Bathyarchaeia archaeon]